MRWLLSLVLVAILATLVAACARPEAPSALAFTMEREGQRNIYTVNTDGDNLFRVTDTMRETSGILHMA